MRIGFDIDGPLALFMEPFMEIIIEQTGKNLFLPIDITDPPAYDFAAHRGYTRKEIRTVWDVIVKDASFWTTLSRNPELDANDYELLGLFQLLCIEHDVYFITNRSGNRAKAQTEAWLKRMLDIYTPTVLLSSDKTGVDKGLMINALKLHTYIDDKIENVRSVCAYAPKCRTYLLDRAYNQLPNDATSTQRWQEVHGYIRIPSMREFFVREGLL